ncbi:MAG: ISAs1 family transposase [Bacteroidota bacterium]
MGLYECFQRLDDPRQKSGLRMPLPALLCMLVMSYLSGHSGYRSTATFMKGNRSELMEMFNLKHPPIGHTQLRTVLQGLDFRAVNQAFFNWMNRLVSIGENEWPSGDGKALASTIADPQGPARNFELMARLFGQKLEVATHAATATNRDGEAKAMQSLLKTLKCKGAVITLDALYCLKKRSTPF